MVTKLKPSRDQRAANPLENPPCARCSDATRVVGVIRTNDFVYFRCTGCDELIVKTLPGVRVPQRFIEKFLN